MKRLFKILFVSIFILCLFGLRSEAAQQFSSIKYDMSLSGSGIPAEMTQTIYIKGENIRTEMNASGKKMIMIVKEGREAYSYMPEQNMAIHIPIPAQKPDKEIDYLKRPEMKIVGQDTVDGRPCDVYQGVIEGKKIKMWVAKDIQFPLRTEVDTERGKVITKNSNIEINTIRDYAVFTLPAGVKIIEMGNMGQMMQNTRSSYGEE